MVSSSYSQSTKLIRKINEGTKRLFGVNNNWIKHLHQSRSMMHNLEDEDFDMGVGAVESSQNYLRKNKCTFITISTVPSKEGTKPNILPSSTRVITLQNKDQSQDAITIVSQVYVEQHPTEQSTEVVKLVSESNIGERLSTTNLTTDQLFTNTQLDLMEKYVRDTSKSFKISADQSLIMNYAWILPAQYRVGRAYGQTLGLDATHSFCDMANLRMGTSTGKDAMGKTFTLMRDALLHEKKWLWCYFTLEIIPKLMGDYFCRHVRAIVTDGDRNLCDAVDIAIKKKIFPNATRIRCTWHIVDRSWNTHIMHKDIYQMNVTEAW